jgi:hypothetical protein
LSSAALTELHVLGAGCLLKCRGPIQRRHFEYGQRRRREEERREEKEKDSKSREKRKKVFLGSGTLFRLLFIFSVSITVYFLPLCL